MQQPSQNYLHNQSYNNNLIFENNIINQRQKSPYGIWFDDEKIIKKLEQKKYKEDLDFLISLRNKKNFSDKIELNNQYNQIQEMNNVKIILFI